MQSISDHPPASSAAICEIEEEELPAVEAGLSTHAGPPAGLRSGGGGGVDGYDVYVAVGKGATSMGALAWALTHVVTQHSLVYLVHVFPEVHQIPMPLGMMPKNQLSKEQVDSYMNQERAKRREMLQKFLNLCHASKVQVDTILIESDVTAKAISDLIPVLNIRRLIVGIAKSNLRRKGNSKAEQIHRSAPPFCEVKIICDGKEINFTEQIPGSSSLPDTSKEKNNKNSPQKQKSGGSVSCPCFLGKFL